MKYTERLLKSASTYSDAAGAIITGSVPSIGGAANMGGSIAALASGPADKSDLADFEKSQGLAFAPGVGSYRLGRRRMAQAAKTGGTGRAQYLSEQLGTGTSIIAAGLLGAGILYGVASAMGEKDAPEAALAGGGLGLAAGGLAAAGGALGALFTRTRTNKEQLEHDASNGSIAANYLIPGVAAYNVYKAMGNQQNGK